MFDPLVSSKSHCLRYSSLSGYFLQNDPHTDPNEFDYTEANFGLVERTYPSDDEKDSQEKMQTQWQRFEREVRRLNEDSGSNDDMEGEQDRKRDGAQHKMLFFARHGEGWHNVAEKKYGTAEWDRYWSKLDGDGTLTWADAELTDLGKLQAGRAGTFWRRVKTEGKMKGVDGRFVSPLKRAVETGERVFGGKEQQEVRAVVKELLREANGVHTCDRRSTKTFLHDRFPEVAFEEGFRENDELWNPDVREVNTELDERMKRLLDDIWKNEEGDWISFTSHSGAIASILRVVGHRVWPLLTGEMMPVLVKGEWMERREMDSRVS